MGTNQTTLSIDKSTKLLAGKRAKVDNIPLSTIVKIFLRDYANGNLNIGSQPATRDENGLTKQEAKELDEAIKDSKDPANLSPAFDNAKDLIKDLHK